MELSVAWRLVCIKCLQSHDSDDVQSQDGGQEAKRQRKVCIVTLVQEEKKINTYDEL